jgi:hypothetical protein
MQDAGRHDDVGWLVEREGVGADEAAVEPLVLGETLRRGDEHAVAVDADQVDAGAEPAAGRQPSHDVPQTAAEIDDADAAIADPFAHQLEHRREQGAEQITDAELFVEPLQLEMGADEHLVDAVAIEQAVGPRETARNGASRP